MIRPLLIALACLVSVGCRNDNGPSRPSAQKPDRDLARLAASIETQTDALLEIARGVKASEASAKLTREQMDRIAAEMAKPVRSEPIPDRLPSALVIPAVAQAEAPRAVAPEYGNYTGAIVWGDPATCKPCKGQHGMIDANAPAAGMTVGESPNFDFWYRKPSPEKKAELGGGEPVIQFVENGVVQEPSIIGWRGVPGEWEAVVALHPCKKPQADPAPKARPTADPYFSGSNRLKNESARRFNIEPPPAPAEEESEPRYASARRSGSSFDNITTPNGRKNRRWDDENDDDYRPDPRPAPKPADCSGYSTASCSGGYSAAATCAGGYSAPSCSGGYTAASCSGGSYSTALNCSGGYPYSAPVYASCSGGYSYYAPSYSYPAQNYSYPSAGWSFGWGGGWGGGHYCNPYTGICY